MADNVTANAGSGGAVFATDDDGVAHHPYCKLEWGADNTQTKVDTGASAIPIQDGGNSLTVDWAGTAPPIGAGVEATALRVTLATDSTGVVSIDDNAGSLTVDNAALSVTGGGVEASALRVTLASDSTGTLTVDNAGTFAVQSTLSAGANLIGDVGISGARTSGGTTIFRSIDLDESEEEIKATAGQIYWIHCMNLAATKRYLKIYNATAASVTVGTTTPVLTFPIPTTGDTNGAGFMFAVPNGVAFGTAITAAATTGIADNDTGAPGANEVIINVGYA